MESFGTHIIEAVDIIRGNSGYISGSNLCLGGHVFVFAGGMENGEVPEGYPCSCGQVRAEYETCPCCGHKKLK